MTRKLTEGEMAFGEDLIENIATNPDVLRFFMKFQEVLEQALRVECRTSVMITPNESEPMVYVTHDPKVKDMLLPQWRDILHD